MNSVVDLISDSEDFHFVGYIISYFDNDFLFSVNMRDCSGYIIFNTHIHYNKYHVLFDKRVFVNIVQFVPLSS